MKPFFNTMLLVLAWSLALAQTRKPDQIVRRDNKTMSVIITEINETQVLYKDPTKPNGTAMPIDKKEIHKLVFANGQEEMLNKLGLDKTANKAAPIDKVSFFLTAGGGGSLYNSASDNKLQGTKRSIALSYFGGVGVHIPFGSMAIAPALSYTQFGGKYVSTDPTDEFYVTVTFQGIQLAVPVMYQAGSPQDNTRFFVGAGPYVTHISAGEVVFSDGIDIERIPVDKNKSLTTVHVGGLAQIGIKTGPVSIFGYGNMSFTNISKIANEKVSVIGFGLGLNYHF